MLLLFLYWIVFFSDMSFSFLEFDGFNLIDLNKQCLAFISFLMFGVIHGGLSLFEVDP